MNIILYIVFLFVAIGVIANIVNFILRIMHNQNSKKSLVNSDEYINNIEDNEMNSSYSTDVKIINNLDDIKKGKVSVKSTKAEEQSKSKVICSNINYKLPSINLLDYSKKISNNQDEIEKYIGILEETFDIFKVKAKIISVTVGPFFTQYEVELEKGEKVSKLTGIKKEISLALAKGNVQIEVPIPGKNTCGIDIDNSFIENINLREILKDMPKDKRLLAALGKDVYGHAKYFDISQAPHVLIAGSTGMGKSICIKSIITSLLMKKNPDELKLVLIDTKRIELSLYNGLPHLLCPVVTDSKKGVAALQKIVFEMEHRYDIFEESHVKDIYEYNQLVEERNKNLNQGNKLPIMPLIVVVIDEISDLVSVAKDDVEEAIMNIVKMARSVGIHLIISTVLPNAPFVTRIVKTNIPTRIAFDVPFVNDSRAILGINGAEKLHGRGDMLFLPPKSISPLHIQGTWISDSEICRVVDYICHQQNAMYDQRFQNIERPICNEIDDYHEEYDDPLYEDIVEFVITTGKASASILQRKFKLGYNRAVRAIDLLEERGIIGPMNGSKTREVLIKLNSNSNNDNNI